MEGKSGKAGERAPTEAGVVVERLVVGVAVELLVVEIENVVDEVRQLQGWKVRRMMVGTKEGIVERLVGVWQGVRWVWRNPGVWEVSVEDHRDGKQNERRGCKGGSIRVGPVGGAWCSK